MSCNDYQKLIQNQLIGPSEDYVGLYEQYWSLPYGDYKDEDFNYSKTHSYDTVMNLNIKLLAKNFLNLYYIDGGHIAACGDLSKIDNKSEWFPFDIGQGPGFLLSSTEKGIWLVSLLNRKFGIPGLI